MIGLQIPNCAVIIVMILNEYDWKGKKRRSGRPLIPSIAHVETMLEDFGRLVLLWRYMIVLDLL